MADPILTEFVKQTLSYPLPGLEPEDPKEAIEELLKTEKSERQTKQIDHDLIEVRVNALGQTVRIHY